jgi:Tfp pilus assembly protein PilO
VSAKLKNLSPAAASALIAAAGLLVLLVGFLVLVLPQSHKAKHLSKELAATQAQIATARAMAAQPPEQRIRVADLFKVVEAMPDDTDMSGIILQLQQTASQAGVKFDSIQPQPSEAGSGYSTVPIDLEFAGNFYSLTDFLFRVRKLVNVHRGTLDARGRLFSVGRVDFEPGDSGLPQITATVRVNAFVYSPAPAVPIAVAATTGTTATTPTSAAVASGATP